MARAKKPKIPPGYEAMELQWEVDPHRSATHLAQQVPVGWAFFQLDRKDTLATVTYIRPIQHDAAPPT